MMDEGQVARLVATFQKALDAKHGIGWFANPRDAGEFYAINETTGQVFMVTVREGRFVVAEGEERA